MRCLDANVWIYYLDETLPEHDRVAGRVGRVLRSDPLFTTAVLQMEVVHYLHAQLDDPGDSVDRFLNLEDVLVAELTGEDVTRASEILQSHPAVGIGGRDATVLAAMERYDVRELWTHDAGLKRLAESLEWLDAIDPVEGGPVSG